MGRMVGVALSEELLWAKWLEYPNLRSCSESPSIIHSSQPHKISISTINCLNSSFLT